MVRIRGIDDFKFIKRLRQPLCRQFFAHIIIPANDQRLAHAGPLIQNRRPQNTWVVPLRGATEALIGLCLWSRRLLPLGLALMAGHMCGTVLPLFTLPEITWKAFPVATLEGQYILKNVVLVAGAIVIAGTERSCLSSLAS